MAHPKFHVHFSMNTGEISWLDSVNYGYVYGEFTRHFQTKELAVSFVSSISDNVDYRDITVDFPEEEKVVIGLADILTNDNVKDLSDSLLDDCFNYLDDNRLATDDDGLTPVYGILMDEANKRYRAKREEWAKGNFLTVNQMDRKCSLEQSLDRNGWIFKYASSGQVSRWQEELDTILTAQRLNQKLSAAIMLSSVYKIISDSDARGLPDLAYTEKLMNSMYLQDYFDQALQNGWNAIRLDSEGKEYMLRELRSTRAIVISRTPAPIDVWS